MVCSVTWLAKNSLKAMADESTQISTSHSGDSVVPHVDEISEMSPGNNASDTLNAYVEPRVVIDDPKPTAANVIANLVPGKVQVRKAKRISPPDGEKKLDEVSNQLITEIMDMVVNDNQYRRWVKNLIRVEERANNSANILRDLVNTCLKGMEGEDKKIDSSLEKVVKNLDLMMTVVEKMEEDVTDDRLLEFKQPMTCALYGYVREIEARAATAKKAVSAKTKWLGTLTLSLTPWLADGWKCNQGQAWSGRQTNRN